MAALDLQAKRQSCNKSPAKWVICNMIGHRQFNIFLPGDFKKNFDAPLIRLLDNRNIEICKK
jgi:hypothetical protein